MDEILNSLPASARVLDLGSSHGSFDAARFRFVTIRLDLDAMAPDAVARTVRGNAARLPFPNASIDAVIANHSLEHFDDAAAALAEVGRVLRPAGALYVAVPDASTLCDRIYRWLARGGGHVNPFTDAAALARQITAATGLPHRATRTLHSSLSFLNRRNHPGPAPRKLWLLGGGNETVLVWLNAALRQLDRAFGTRASVYGWALYFGDVAEPIDLRPRRNMCARCGAGHLAEWLAAQGAMIDGGWFRCPGCGARNRTAPG